MRAPQNALLLNGETTSLCVKAGNNFLARSFQYDSVCLVKGTYNFCAIWFLGILFNSICVCIARCRAMAIKLKWHLISNLMWWIRYVNSLCKLPYLHTNFYRYNGAENLITSVLAFLPKHSTMLRIEITDINVVVLWKLGLVGVINCKEYGRIQVCENCRYCKITIHYRDCIRNINGACYSWNIVTTYLKLECKKVIFFWPVLFANVPLQRGLSIC